MRCFPTVEACCKSMSGGSYVGIPPNKSFVNALRMEVGLADAGIFVESRDKSNKPALYPTFEINVTENKRLWPIVVMENRGLIYCALPLMPQEAYTSQNKSDVSLADLPSVSTAVEAILGLSQCVSLTSSMTSLTPALTMQLHQFVNTCMPFGNVMCTNPALTTQLINPTGKGKAKQPFWNPGPHKGKSQVVIHIKEEIRCMQFSHSEVQDVLEVYGSVICKVEVEGTAPEICVNLTQPGSDGRGLAVSPEVSNVENTAVSSRLRFRPCNSQPLCHYSLPHLTEPPIHGAFKLTVNNNLATVHMQLQLQTGMKNQFQQLEVHIPFSGLQVMSVKPSPSVGSVSVQADNLLVWNVGSKFPTKTLTATLNAICKLRKLQKKTDKQQTDTTDTLPSWERSLNSCALVHFKVADHTYSNTRIDPQSIIISTANKVRCSITSECVSGQYKIWNSEGEVPITAEMPVQELQDLFVQ
ncbi:AP-5 complex subunit mu-1-like isoform X2 [Periplaneta americana]|uniref:AP-5 complex subunit mu-1-like isoform X2 n=1 Tax=Periplaneta americana TaxID=6978 RepID=UPI0037E7F1A6